MLNSGSLIFQLGADGRRGGAEVSASIIQESKASEKNVIMRQFIGYDLTAWVDYDLVGISPDLCGWATTSVGIGPDLCGWAAAAAGWRPHAVSLGDDTVVAPRHGGRGCKAPGGPTARGAAGPVTPRVRTPWGDTTPGLRLSLLAQTSSTHTHRLINSVIGQEGILASLGGSQNRRGRVPRRKRPGTWCSRSGGLEKHVQIRWVQ